MNFAWRSLKLSGRPMVSQKAIAPSVTANDGPSPSSDPTVTCA